MRSSFFIVIFSINELFEHYVRITVLNEQLKSKKSDINTTLSKTENIFSLKKTNWKELDEKLISIREGLPENYKFDRELANER